MGESAARESRAEIRAREHNHSHHVVHIAEAKGSTDDEFDFVVGSLGACVGEPELSGSNDSEEVTLDFLAQFPKGGYPAPLGPSHPLGKRSGNLIRPGFERQTQILFEQVSPVESGIALVRNCNWARWFSDKCSGFLSRA